MKRLTRATSLIVIAVLTAVVILSLSVLVLSKYVKNLDGTPKQVTVLATEKTTLFSDGTLIINEKLSERELDIASHGSVVNSYAPLNAQNPYIWTDAGDVLWHEEVENIKNVLIRDGSIKPVSTAYWFNGMNNESFTSLDLSALDTSNVVNMTGMFAGCSNLKEIDTSELFVTSALDPSPQEMFTGCVSLQGGAGTKYIEQDENVRDLSIFARIDGEGGQNGYFTGEEPPSDEHLYFGVSEVGSSSNDSSKKLYISNYQSGLAPTQNDKALNSTKPEDCGWDYARKDIVNITIEASSYDKKIAPKSMAYWFSGMEPLQEITGLFYLNTSNLTNMSCMFEGCSNLAQLDLADFDTKNVEDFSGLFDSCDSLEKLDVSSFNTPSAKTMESMFKDCDNLKTIYASDKFAAVSEPNMFNGCNSLVGGAGTTYVGMPKSDRNSSKYARIDRGPSSNAPGYFSTTNHLFYGISSDGTLHLSDCMSTDTPNRNDEALNSKGTGDCKWLTRASEIKKIAVSSDSHIRPQSMAFWFHLCSNLTEIGNLGTIDTSNVTSMESLFASCRSLTEVTLSKFDTSNVTNMEDIFGACKSVEYIDISAFDTSKVSSMSDMFTNCKNLKTICASDTFVTTSLLDKQPMFGGCDKLEGDNGTKYATEEIYYKDYSEYAHLDGGVLNPGYFSSNHLYYGISEDNILYLSNKMTEKTPTNNDEALYEGSPAACGWNNKRGVIVKVIICEDSHIVPKTISGWFRELSQCTEIDNLGTIDTFNVSKMGQIFLDCNRLTKLDLSGFNTSKVTEMNYMFCGCSSLSELNFSNFNTSKVTEMNYMFYGCSSLSKLNLSGFNTSNVTEMSSMFSECSSLSELNLSSFDTSNVTEMSSMFSECSSLSELNLSNFNTSSVTHMEQMFAECSSLPELDLSSFDTSKVINMGFMFTDCQKLEKIYASDKFVTSSLQTEYTMFNDCDMLQGGAGTRYSEMPSDRSKSKYARIDQGPESDAQGYFTEASANDAPQTKDALKKDEQKSGTDSTKSDKSKSDKKDMKKEDPYIDPEDQEQEQGEDDPGQDPEQGEDDPGQDPEQGGDNPGQDDKKGNA